MTTVRYVREQAVTYARKWALSRNPRYLDFHNLGGDCTNFVSQCLYYANPVMNYTKTFGWYYISADNRAPAWTGVPYLYNFLTGNKGVGPFAAEVPLADTEPGDIIQLGSRDGRFYHSLLVTETGAVPNPSNILIAAHTFDALDRPLDSYSYFKARTLHIEGVRHQ